jgi:prevent-host-death family protein
MKTVTAAHANRQFSAVLRDVAHGERVLITSRGKPVAALVPADDAVAAEERRQAHARLMARLRSQPALGPVDWSRDELYDV